MTYSTVKHLQNRTGKYSAGRYDYLQQLVTEFTDTADQDDKIQILAHLANFAYDPINYEHLIKLNVTELFLDCLDEDNAQLVEFAAAGLCNMILEPRVLSVVTSTGGISQLVKQLSSTNMNTLLSAVLALYYIATSAPEHQPAIATRAVLQAMLKYAQSTHTQLRNVAALFVQTLHA
jgi:hypothetical protein